MGTFGEISPVLKWAGGKSRLLPFLMIHKPEQHNYYYEPFLGGGAFAFALKPDKAVFSDSNRELINFYKEVRRDVDAVLFELRFLDNTKEDYYRIRNLDRDSDFIFKKPEFRAARFLYLNKTCFNGIWRVNSKGQNNVSYGNMKISKYVDEHKLRKLSEYLNTNYVQIYEADYNDVICHAREDDLVYLDPPYVPISKTSNFTSYAKEGFGLDDQKDLYKMFKTLHEKGVKLMLSNSDTDFTRDLYSEFKIHETMLFRGICGDGYKRKTVGELLIVNY